MPRYIFHHMIWALKESEEKQRAYIPYGRLLSKIFHQGRILEALRLSKVVTDKLLGTMVGKYINGATLKHIYLVNGSTLIQMLKMRFLFKLELL